MGFQYVERVLSQKPGSGVCVAMFALKNCPCSLSKTLIVFPVVALKNPGRGLVLIVCSLKNPDGFRVDRVLSQKFYRGSVDLEEHLLARRTTGD